MELRHLTYSERDHQEDEAREGEDDDNEHHSDGGQAWEAEMLEANDARLDQERDRSPQHERADEVAEEVENDDSDDQGGETECDLEVAAPALRIERPSGATGSA